MLTSLALALAVTAADRVADAAGEVAPGRPATATVPAPTAGRTLSMVVSLRDPARLGPAGRVGVVVEVGGATFRKDLHLGDPDAAWLLRQPAEAEARVTLRAEGAGSPLPYTVRATAIDPGPGGDGVAFEAEPNDRPEDANELPLGRSLHGLADDRPYLPRLGAPPETGPVGEDWFTFEFQGDRPRLAFFALDFVDRDVPPDVRVYRMVDGSPVEAVEGIDPQSLQRERPPRPGANKFTTRVLAPGRYHVRVDACQPDYRLRARLLDAPPYLKPDEAEAASPEAVASAARKAIRTAMDFQLLAGDSWHANTPRKGHPLDRVANAHQETSTCIACHPTHFTTQSALAAVRSGYPIGEPDALRFLTDRLANNPTPFHGHPEALWARMIPAPANVMGRLSTILMDLESLVAGPPRDRTHRGVAEFLKLYYDGRAALPPDESNGNNPVSRYKVATDAWRQLDEVARRTGDPRFATTRDLVARLLPTGEVSNTRDLAAQTIGLCLVDRPGLGEKIRGNVDRLLALQHADGHWPIAFAQDSPGAEMQTGESLYALALAGLTPDHPAVRKGVVALLARQKPFGGWLDLGPYEQFQTPFRETQWALMALSRLYPGPGSKGWGGDGPAAIRGESPPARIADLDRIQDVPEPGVLRSVVGCLDDPELMVRLAAARALARVGGPGDAPSLVRALGDESKVVQRAAAEALRAIGDRDSAGDRPTDPGLVHALADAIGSRDDRTRRGATRVFAAHFRDLSRELALADALLARLADPDPVVRMQAIKGLWRWWYWQADPGLRGRIEDALIARLGEPEHPWARRNLVEALYIIGDENIRYLHNNWIPALAKKESRDRATAAQHATANRLGGKFVAALATGNALLREGILRSMSEFPERPVIGGRVGNDLEPMLFYDDAPPRVAAALAGQLADPDPMIRRLALQALVTLRGRKDPALARAVLARQGDADPAVREWAGTMAAEFPAVPDLDDPALAAVLGDLLARPVPEAQAAALGVIARMKAAGSRPGWAEAVRSRLEAPSPVVRAASLRAVAATPAILDEPAARAGVARALADPDLGARVAAVRLALDRAGLVPESALRKALEDPSPAHRVELLGAMAGSKAYAADLRLIGPLSNALGEEDRGAREKALQVIQTHPALVDNPAVAEGLRDLSRSDNPRQKEMATSLLRSRGRSSAGASAADRLDPAFFEAKVLPIFEAPGQDGQSCIGCHRSHSILKLVPPAEGGRWTPEAARANFRATLRVVDLADPQASLLLGKPTWEAAEEAEAQRDRTRKAHAGGVRFEPGTSPEYQTLLDWINGARLKPGP